MNGYGTSRPRLMMHLTAPFCAVRGGVLHGAKMTSRPLKSKRKTYDAGCGAQVKPLAWPVQGRPDTVMTASWPPYVDDARSWGYERCRECMKALPGRPERPPFAPESAA